MSNVRRVIRRRNFHEVETDGELFEGRGGKKRSKWVGGEAALKSSLREWLN